jgi:phospholipid/cholesterol/gamma-HCH transport system substrate-binding protein
MSEHRDQRPRRGLGRYLSQLVGLATVLVFVGVVVLATVLYRHGFTKTVPLTVLSQRAGLVMNPDAKVKMHDVQVGRVTSIVSLPNGQAAIHIAVDATSLAQIPSNVAVDVASSTTFGAKFVQLVSPPNPSPQPLQAGQVIDAQRVTVEFNTVFQQLTAVLGQIQPQKLNATLGAVSAALSGRGKKFGQALADLDSYLAAVQPSLPSLEHVLQVTPDVLNAYADAAPDLLRILDSTTTFSQSIVDEQQALDAFLVSTTGLADTGNDVIGGNRSALTDVLHLLVPTTALLDQYHQGLNCAISGIIPYAKQPPNEFPGLKLSASLTLGLERYRYPQDLPKVAATGGPFCLGLPRVPMSEPAPFVVTDIGANPWRYANQGILLNSDGLKQLLFGPIDGPPRNSAQVGQPG